MKKTITLIHAFLLLICFSVYAQSLDSALVSYYPFDNQSMADNVGIMDWFSIPTQDAAEDRFSNPLGAIQLKRTAMPYIPSPNVFDMPSGASPRSISVWFKLNQMPLGGLSDLNFIFYHGANVVGQGFGLGVGLNQVVLIGYLDDLVANVNLSVNQWHHLVGTYDGFMASLYLDGILVGQGQKIWNTAVTNANLGFFNTTTISNPTGGTTVYNNYFDGAIDDMRIYRRNLSQTDVDSLFNPNISVGIQNDISDSQLMIYPNPLRNGKLNISRSNLDNLNELIQIFDLNGTVVFQQEIPSTIISNIDISHLRQGFYILKNGTISKKLIIE